MFSLKVLLVKIVDFGKCLEASLKNRKKYMRLIYLNEFVLIAWIKAEKVQNLQYL